MAIPKIDEKKTQIANQTRHSLMVAAVVEAEAEAEAAVAAAVQEVFHRVHFRHHLLQKDHQKTLNILRAHPNKLIGIRNQTYINEHLRAET
jgi:hypothetical protein